MRKILVIVIAVLLFLCMGITAVFASENKGTGFVDANSNCICDNREEPQQNNLQCKYMVDEDKDGICDNRKEFQKENINCANYSDEDNDGICDNRSESCPGKGKGNGFGKGKCNGNGNKIVY